MLRQFARERDGEMCFAASRTPHNKSQTKTVSGQELLTLLKDPSDPAMLYEILRGIREFCSHFECKLLHEENLNTQPT